ncbi:hypothetical protein V493_00246 [Pseudogymnoascus sp. VKM F-4281 (FW-2241)]|nr:hypothetical protein V493_00246 [Pseudogymnoascus sp. VKM F-4281 (FW-2241)]
MIRIRSGHWRSVPNTEQGLIPLAIVEAIAEGGKHKIIVLARKSNEELAARLGAPIIAVDYFNVLELTQTLEKHGVYTVISTINMRTTEGKPLEIELIRAANASKEIEKQVQVARKYCAKAAIEKTKDLKTTVVYNSYFFDYYIRPQIKTYLGAATLFVDMEHDAALIPGDRTNPVVYSHTSDVRTKFKVAYDTVEDLKAGN